MESAAVALCRLNAFVSRTREAYDARARSRNL